VLVGALAEGAFVIISRSVRLMREIDVHAGEEGCAALNSEDVVRVLAE
jgi:hypothetical protein